jgi:hypothetical protein
MRKAGLFMISAALTAGAAHAASGPPSGTVAARVLVSPMTVTLLVPTAPVDAGKNFKLQATVANAAPTLLQNVGVSLVASNALTLRDPVTQRLASIAAGSFGRVQWDACATSLGGYVVLARATTGPFTSESSGQLVQVASARKPKC